MKYIIFVIIFITISVKSYSEVLWADKVLGFSSQKDDIQYSAYQVTGKPSVKTDFGETPCAWLVKELSAKTEWVKVSFKKNINVSQISVFENNFPGAITGIFLYDSLDQGFRVYTNLRPKPERKKGRVLNINIKKTDYKVYALKIEISLAKYFEPYQIDAIAVSDEITEMTEYINEVSSQNNYVPELLNSDINSPSSEIAPIISADGKTLYFTRENHPENTKKFNDQDIWYSTKDSNGIFQKPINIGPPLNNEYSNYVISVSPDNNMLILGSGYKIDGSLKTGITRSVLNGKEWSYPESIVIQNYYNNNSTASFNMANNNKILLMSVERNETYGGNDIYVSFSQKNNTWTIPVNIGSDINTAANEASPFLASDNKTLYFATSGRPGYGDYDLFVSKRLDDSWTKWSEPVNLGPSINSNGWDAYYTIDAKGEYAYFVSSEKSVVNTDIYRVQLSESVKPGTVTLITGKVLNKNTLEPVSAKIIYEILSKNEDAGVARSNPETGKFSLVLPNGYNYGFLAEAKDYLSINQNIDLTDINEYREISKDIYLVPAKAGEKITLNNIFFETGDYKLLKTSYNELKRLTNFLENNPKVKIQINGHTDNIGSENDNMILSKNRANSVKSYLIENGITSDRITTKAYGEKNPVADNNTTTGRKLNRRVEFEIINN